MDWQRYKELCDRPNVLSRWMLEQTGELLSGPLALELERTMAGAPLPKPEDHQGGAGTDMFVLDLSMDAAMSISATVSDAIAEGRTTSATAARGLDGFGPAWREYVDFLQHGG